MRTLTSVLTATDTVHNPWRVASNTRIDVERLAGVIARVGHTVGRMWADYTVCSLTTLFET